MDPNHASKKCPPQHNRATGSAFIMFLHSFIQVFPLGCHLSVYADKLTLTNVLHYPKWPLQIWLEDPIERALAVFAGTEVEDTSDDFLAL